MARDEDRTDTTVLLVLEHLVAPRRVFEGEPVRHEVRRVELATRSVLEEPGQVFLPVLLRGANGQPFVHDRAHRELVDEPEDAQD